MKIGFIILGSISLGLGIIGIVLPILPTTPFLLLAATLYLHGSPKMYKWLIEHKHFGTYIRNFKEHRAIPLRVKIISVSMVWATLLYCTFFTTGLLWLRLLFIVLAIGITWHILSYKMLK